MRTNLPRQHRPVGDQEPAQRRDAGEARLWHIGTALAVSFTGQCLVWQPWPGWHGCC
jgi:hypothetical protein